jgi:membrane protease YdiL (CAAX protease family)
VKVLRPLLSRVVDGLLTFAVGVGVAFAIGALFVWLWAPAPTPENSSPPPEAFLFLFGALIGFFLVVFARLLILPLWLRRRDRLGRDPAIPDDGR